MSQHTPGPWINAFDLGEIINAQRVIARLLRGGPMYVAEDEANARLIAAAPELLEALKGLLTATLVEGTSENLIKMEVARKAIVKAEGRDPVSLQEEIDRS